MSRVKAEDLVCRKMRGGKKTLWNAFLGDRYNKYPHNIVGAGNTAENAIKDYQKQSRARSLRLIPGVV